MRMTVYFAGGMYGPEEKKRFEYVRRSTADASALPYLTKNPDGLRMTEHHASLYRLTPDLHSAILVDRRNDLEGKNPPEVDLTEEQAGMFREAIRKRYFFA